MGQSMNIPSAKGSHAFSKNDYKTATYKDILPDGSHAATTEFLQRVVDKMFDHMRVAFDRNEKVLEFENPEDLKKNFDFHLPVEPMNLSEIITDCERTLKHSVNTANPRFFNQLYQGVDIVSLAAEWVTSLANTNIFTYEVAPVFTVIEEIVLKRMRSIVGWEDGDGLFSPGGSISNLYALQAAKHYRFPNTKDDGLFGMPKLIIYTSDQSHYSVSRSAAILGFGMNQLRLVPTDECGKMIPEVFERLVRESIENKEVPLMVCLTAGTTVLGAYDPILAISDICKEHNIWLHVDAAWGGGALVSKTHRHLMEGIERADSITWNPHKLLGTILQCSAILMKHKGILHSCNQMNATYLFQKDKHYDMSYDTGDKTIQCGRHVDVFKFWLMWRAKGDIGLEQHIDKLFDLAKLVTNEIKRRDNFEMVLENPECTNVCFWFIPKSLREMDRNSDEFKSKLHKIAPKIKEKMMIKGSMMIGYQPVKDKPNFFRLVLANAATQDEDMYFLLDEIESLGQDL